MNFVLAFVPGKCLIEGHVGEISRTTLLWFTERLDKYLASEVVPTELQVKIWR